MDTEQDWRNLVNNPIHYDEDTEKLAQQLVTLWKKWASFGCFGGGFAGDVSWCQCAGESTQQHFENQRMRADALDELRFKIEEHHGHPVTIFTHYNDVWVHCQKCTWGFGLDGNGAIKETRVYA